MNWEKKKRLLFLYWRQTDRHPYGGKPKVMRVGKGVRSRHSLSSAVTLINTLSGQTSFLGKSHNFFFWFHGTRNY